MSTGEREVRPDFTRRAFLLAAAATAAGGTLYLGARRRSADVAAASSPWSRWLLDANNLSAVRRLGEAYLEAQPAEREAETLNALIDKALGASQREGDAGADADAAGVALQRRVREEYARGEVVNLIGWVVSVTEARLYALVSIDHT